jgi:hypothetical protein
LHIIHATDDLPPRHHTMTTQKGEAGAARKEEIIAGFTKSFERKEAATM